jgi:hypothetical protein
VLDSCDNVYVAARGIPSWFFYSSQLDGQTGRRFAKFEKLFRFGAPAFGDARPESLNFPNPGGDLHLRSGCRSEIYGFASGTPNWSRSEQMRDVPRVPKEGWAENEIHRMTAGRSSPFWLYLGEAGWFEIQPIVDGLTRAGWKLIPVGIEPTPAVLFPYHGLTIYRVEKPCRTHRAERTTPGDHAAF